MGKNNLKKFAIVFVVGGLLLMIFGLSIGLLDRDTELNGKNSNENSEEKLAISILEKLCIDDFLRHVCNSNVELNKNILDIGNQSNMSMYFYANDNLTKYKIKAYDTGVVYSIVKYNDYFNEHKRVFGIEPDMSPDFDMAASVVFSIPNFLENTNQEITTNDVRVCDKDSYDNCFVMLVPDYDNNTGIKFSALSIDDKKISGNIRATVTTENLETYLDGSFEFEFEKQGNDYIVKSLKIVSVADSYNSVDRK